MKRIIALILVLCMTAGMIVSVSADSPFAKKLNLVRLIRAMFASDEDAPEFGELDDGKLIIYVAENGKKDAKGTEKAPLDSISTARDIIRGIDKSDFDGINVIVKSGTYSITDPIAFTAEDSGTKNCPISYIGENGAKVVGGVALTAKDFAPATGEVSKYFSDEVKDKIVQVDLQSLGFTADEIQGWLKHANYRGFHSFLSVDGARQTVARYPNEGWLHAEGGKNIGLEGEEVTEFTNSTELDYYLVEYGEDHFDRVMSWKSGTKVFVQARWNVLWCPDDSYIREFDTTTDIMKVDFNGGYSVTKGAIFYWYNIPEELDVPGEYIIGTDNNLYYYPTENFDTATLTLPVSKNFITLNDTGYLTFDGITFVSALDDGIVAKDVTDITIKNCDISSVVDYGIDFNGNNYNVTIQGNHIYDIGGTAIEAFSGKYEHVVAGNTRVYNNYIHDWAYNGGWGYAISVSGVDILVDHNTCHDSNFKGIHVANCINTTVEYNHVFDVLNLSDDVGAISGDGRENANLNIQYNYVHDVGAQELTESIKAVNPDWKAYPGYAFYYDGMSSYFTTTGNVAAAIYGGGILSNAGRHNYIYGNLFVDCASTYVDAAGYGYLDTYFDENGNYKSKKKTTVPEYVHFDEYKAINPEPSQLILTMENQDPYDRMVWLAPAFIKINNNWCHYNRGVRLYSNWGVTPYYIDAAVWRYSDAEDIDFPKDQIRGVNDNVTTYNSRRDEVNLKTLITETAAGVIEITWEQFEQIGINLEDWALDVEIPEKTIVFEKGYTYK